MEDHDFDDWEDNYSDEDEDPETCDACGMMFNPGGLKHHTEDECRKEQAANERERAKRGYQDEGMSGAEKFADVNAGGSGGCIVMLAAIGGMLGGLGIEAARMMIT